jgi:hypothetical protein
MKKRIIVSAFISLSLCHMHISCTAPSRITSSNEGVIIKKSRVFDSISQVYQIVPYRRDIKIWYKDSAVILECYRLFINNMGGADEKWRTETDHYTYLDLRTKAFYDYKNFSDTAAIIKKYTQEDSVNIEGSWRFYKYTEMLPTENRAVLSDTIIRGILFQRISASKSYVIDGAETLFRYTGYVRCDRKKTIFHLDRKFNEKERCPMTIFEYEAIGKSPRMLEEVEYLTDTLTPFELKVFEKWQQNAKSNPVK